ncbi:putative endonuclease [Peptoniphilus olsenii]|uniref:Endonuclease n=1 Tax=Peptoniphilus olsenii TaxID=411570 RepID=A0ABV2JCR6_9FIRM
MNYYIYILSNINNKTIYIGVTRDIIKRVYQHKSKAVEGFTQKYNIHKLVYYEIYEDINLAIEREKQLKNWSRKKKNALIEKENPEWKDLWSEIIE